MVGYGDLYGALAHVARLDLDVPLRTRWRLLRELGGVRLLRPPPRPEQEVVRLRGRRHSKARDFLLDSRGDPGPPAFE